MRINVGAIGWSPLVLLKLLWWKLMYMPLVLSSDQEMTRSISLTVLIAHCGICMRNYKQVIWVSYKNESKYDYNTTR